MFKVQMTMVGCSEVAAASMIWERSTIDYLNSTNLHLVLMKSKSKILRSTTLCNCRSTKAFKTFLQLSQRRHPGPKEAK